MSRKIYAVIGDPIAHSLSPVMHNAAFRALGLDAEYIAVHVKAEDLEAFAADARKNLAGFNITVPHKKGIIPFLDEVAHPARIAGSVNTVLNRDGRLVGCSTDGYGLETAMNEAFGWSVPGGSAVFIGCGGAAHAAAFYFAGRGLRRMFILNRTLATAESLAGELKTNFPGFAVETAALSDTEKVKMFLAQSEAAIQCTSLGLKPDDPPPIDPELLPQNIKLFDTIYKPTPLLRYAKEHGIAHAAGLGMLLHQGARSFHIWTGEEAPVEVMRQALPPVPEI